MFIDPFLRLIDLQLRSLQGRLEDITILGCFPQISNKASTPEDMLIDAFDKKYHQGALQDDLGLRILYYRQEGYSQMEIAAFERVNQSTISRVERKIGQRA